MTNFDREGHKASLAACDEAKLIALAQKQLPYNSDAYSKLMNMHQGYIYATCRRVLGDQAEAEDATQDVMIRVFHKITNFKSESSFKTWLFTIARNVCFTSLAKRKKTIEIHEQYGVESASFSHTLEKAAEAQDHIDVVFKKLTHDERSILALRYMAELEISEIATVNEMSLSATKMRLYRAIERFKVLSEEST